MLRAEPTGRHCAKMENVALIKRGRIKIVDQSHSRNVPLCIILDIVSSHPCNLRSGVSISFGEGDSRPIPRRPADIDGLPLQYRTSGIISDTYPYLLPDIQGDVCLIIVIRQSLITMMRQKS